MGDKVLNKLLLKLGNIVFIVETGIPQGFKYKLIPRF